MFAKNYRPDDDWHTLPRAPLRSHADYLEFCRCLLDETGHQEWDDILCALGVFRTDHWTHYAASYAMLLPLPAHLALPAPVWLFLAATIIAYCQPLQQALAARMSWKHELFFCLLRLSRHYLPPVADYGEKDEREVRRSRTVQKG